MSRNYLRCSCGVRLLRVHHSGRPEFLVAAARAPNGGYRLTCPCGIVRNWFAKEVAQGE